MIYRVLVLLLLTTISAIAQSAPKVQATGSITAVKTMVNALYHSVVIHHPYSLLDGPDKNVFPLSQRIVISETSICARLFPGLVSAKPRKGCEGPVCMVGIRDLLGI